LPADARKLREAPCVAICRLWEFVENSIFDQVRDRLSRGGARMLQLAAISFPGCELRERGARDSNPVRFDLDRAALISTQDDALPRAKPPVGLT
jgi:hypothetical protein